MSTKIKKTAKFNIKKNDSYPTDDKKVKTADPVIDDTRSIHDIHNIHDAPKYYQTVVKINTSNMPNIFDSDAIIKFSNNLDYPNFSCGFHHFIHSNKNKMDILKNFEGKKKAYLVMNDFERYVDNYDNNIGDESKKYFNITTSIPNILSRGFYKLWEILLMYDLIDIKQENFISAHLAEGPGSFIQATMFYRDTFSKKSKNDKFYAVTLHSEDLGGHIPELEKNFIEFYEKEKPQRFILHKTYTKQVAGASKQKDNGDITDPKTIKLFGGQMADKAHFITADGGFEWINENVQEQEAYRLILAQIIAAVKIQRKGGHFVCKFFETFTLVSAKLISMLSNLYNKVYFVKPLMSRPSNSEKYAICMNFKYDDSDKEFQKILKKMDELLKISHTHSTDNEKIIDIFSSYNIPQSLHVTLIQLNITIANKQLKSINEIISFIEAQNFYGDIYQEHREKQIAASKYWINTFLPNPNIPIDEIRNNLQKIINYSEKRNLMHEESFRKELYFPAN